MTLSEISIRRPVFATMLSVSIVVLGIMGFSKLGVNLFPDVTFPIVTITTVYPGATPNEIESQVSEKIEDAVVSLSGINRMESFSRDSVSVLVIVFDLDVDLKEAAVQVRERVAQVRSQLPTDAKEPTVARLDVGAAPILNYTLSGPNPDALRDVADDIIRPSLEQVEGVASVNVLGGYEREVQVEVDLNKAKAVGQSPVSIADRIRMENMNVPAGDLDQGKQNIQIRTLGQFKSVEDIGNMPIGFGPQLAQVKLSDVATVVDGKKEVKTIVRSNGLASVVFEVQKGSGSNTVEVAARVQEKLKKTQLPPGVEAHMIVNQATFILENIHEVNIALFFGGAMAILIILLFLLDFRSTFISALALPTSVLGAFFLMWMLGFTINMMTLLGLSLAIGLLIDDSIVVRENIVKYLERGMDPTEAAIHGTKEITLAVLATTATLCAVFIPIAFTEGIVGQFFREFGLTVAGATVLSAWVAFTLDPMLSARLATKPHEKDSPPRGIFAPFWSVWELFKQRMLKFYDALDRVYAWTLAWILGKKRRLIATGIASFLIFMVSGQLMGMLGFEFVPPEDRGQWIVDVQMPAGVNLKEISDALLPAEMELKKDPNILTVYSRVGLEGQTNASRWRVVAVQKPDRIATRPMTPWDVFRTKVLGQPKVAQLELEAKTREIIKRHVPRAEVMVTPPGIVEGAQEAPMAFYIKGTDLKKIEGVANRFAALMRTVPGVRDVDLDYSPGSPQLTPVIDREKAARLGVPGAMIGRSMRAAIEGELAGVYRENNDEIDIRVRLSEEDRTQMDHIEQIPIQTPMGFIPIKDVATLVRSDGPAEIHREGRSRMIMLSAVPYGRALGDVLGDFEKLIAQETLPAGITYSLEGQAKTMRESNSNMGTALLLGLVFIYLVLASQFESFLHPITIMMALPLALVGAAIALYIQGSTMSIGTMIGIILLMGLVTKNGILLIDHAVSKVREGYDPKSAILESGPARLRPILMTSAAMVLGMLPTAFGNGPGSEFRGPMAMGVIGGVISSTFLTLFVVPVIYMLVENMKEFFTQRVGQNKFMNETHNGSSVEPSNHLHAE